MAGAGRPFIIHSSNNRNQPRRTQMGLFNQMKQMKQITAETPELIRSAMALQQAQAQAAEAAMAAAVSAPGLAAGQRDADSIAGVSLVEYAAVTRTATDRGITDPAGFAVIAREHGIDPTMWDAAMVGWAQRFTVDSAAAMRFNALWRGAN
jgi:hypothetical protein